MVLEGVETERSSNGTASRASEGVTDGEGESGRWRGDVMLDSGGEGAMSGVSASAMTPTDSRAMACCESVSCGQQVANF